MPLSLLTYKCLIISPGDVDLARASVFEALVRWNSSIGRALDLRVDPIMWESHARPEMGSPPQDVLNRQIVDDADFGIALFGARLGTPTATFGSGSVEEIERLRKVGAQVMVYFATSPIPPDVDLTQLSALRAFQERLSTESLYFEYDSEAQLQNHVTHHVTAHLSERAKRDRFTGGTFIEPRTSDPESPKAGQIWLRTDL